MSPDHRGNFAVEIPCHRRFFTGRFGMDVHDDALHRRRQLCYDFFGGFKRTCRAVFHENASQQGNHSDVAACRIAENAPAASGLKITEIRGTHQIPDRLDFLFEIFLIPGMIARSEHIHHRFHIADAGQAVPCPVGTVFPVGNHKRCVVTLFQNRNQGFDGIASALPHDVSDK